MSVAHTDHVELTKEQLATLQMAFDMFDTDKSGAISKDELGSVMKKLGYCPTDEELRDVIREHDTDESGQIEFSEFCDLMAKHMKEEDQEETLQAAFRTFDKDGSGYISADELRQVMHTLGETLTDEEIEDMIREADTDGDGQINYQEFVSMMKTKD